MITEVPVHSHDRFTAATRAATPKACTTRIFAVVVIAAALSTARPAAAAPDCDETAQQLEQMLVLNPPVSPRVLLDVLALQRVGLRLCDKGAASQGSAKLEQALLLASRGAARGLLTPPTYTSPLRLDD